MQDSNEGDFFDNKIVCELLPLENPDNELKVVNNNKIHRYLIDFLGQNKSFER